MSFPIPEEAPVTRLDAALLLAVRFGFPNKARLAATRVSMAFFRSLLRTTGFSANRRYSIEHCLKQGAVMDIGAGEPYGERNAASVGYQVPLRARFAAIRWILARGRAPFFADKDDEST